MQKGNKNTGNKKAKNKINNKANKETEIIPKIQPAKPAELYFLIEVPLTIAIIPNIKPIIENRPVKVQTIAIIPKIKATEPLSSEVFLSTQ